MKILDIGDKIKNKLKDIIKKQFGSNQKLINVLKALNPPSIKNLIIFKQNIKQQVDLEQPSDKAKEIDSTKRYLSKRWGVIAKQRLDYQKNEKKIAHNWLDSEIIERYYIRPKVSGDVNVWWLTYIANKYIPKKLPYGLSLGCGDGVYERGLIQHGKCNEIDAFDISEEAIGIAKMAAKEKGIANFINYQTVDINTIKLPEQKYGLVLCNMALHHFRDLENLYLEISKSLNKDGLFIFNEFVGPSQFQWTDKQVKIINDILKILSEKYKYQPLYKRYKNSFSRPTIEEMNSTDPSEAIRSKDIIPKLKNYFSIIEKKDYGGTILHMLLQDIICNFNENVQEDMAILRLIFYIEGILLREGCIESDFSMVVCKKKSI